MSKTLKGLQVILIISYIIVISQLIHIITNKYEEIIELQYITPTPGLLKKMNRELRMLLQKQNNNGTVQIHTTEFKKPDRLPTDLIYILKFSTPYTHFNNPAFQNGQKPFIQQKCKYINCVFTDNINLLIDIRNFDAVLLDVEHEWEGHPFFRSPDQKYIFSATESADYYPICSQFFDNYYNLTWTYKLDSDIPWTHFTIRNKTGHIIGPKVQVPWIEKMEPTTKDVKKFLEKKSIAAAWFVSNCRSKSPRLQLTKAIEKELQVFGHKVDIYGQCGNLTCPKESHYDCLNVLKENYYFYFVFENSMSEDYVTEKLLYAVNHYTVPVVFGGSDYSRFLPPGSYINAGELDAKKVAQYMNAAIQDKNIYYEYFRWHNHYTYKAEPQVSNICALCQYLNEQTTRKVVKDFRKWWYPDFEKRCKEPKVDVFGKDPRAMPVEDMYDEDFEKL